MLDRVGVHGRRGAGVTRTVGDGRRPGPARRSLRLSLGRTNAPGDVDAVLDVLPPAVERARQAALASAGVR